MSRMKFLSLCFALLLLALTIPARARADHDIGMFYDALAPYGDWISLPDYGWVWAPDDVPVGWRPYTDGYWVYTDFGWTWVSDQPWGWAPFHYGRWFDSDTLGWVWIPGTEWGPAWVAWRYGDDCIGWAPLPPSVGWSPDLGLIWGSFDVDRDYNWHVWSFCEPRYLNDHKLRRHLWGVERNMALLRRSRNVTEYGNRDHHVWDRGYDVDRLEQVTGRRVPRLVLNDMPELRNGRGVRVEKGVIFQYRPAVAGVVPEHAPPPGRPGRAFDPDAARARMQDQQRKQARELQAQHQRELKRAGAGEPRDQIVTRQRQEESRLRKYQARQKAIAENRARRTPPPAPHGEARPQKRR